MKFRLLVFICFLGAFAKAQTLKGTVYDATETLADVSVQNLTQNIQTYTDKSGVFEINAQVNDSLAFYVFPYAPQIRKVRSVDLKDPIVVELKEENNTLDEVLLEKVRAPQPYNSVVYQERLERAILNDIQENSQLYSPPSNYQMDFIAIFKLIKNLFKRKDKGKNLEKIMITSTDLAQHFETSDVFTDQLLVNELDVPLEDKLYFFDFCTLKGIEISLLQEENAFFLVDRLITISKEYKEIVNSIKG